MSEFFKRVITGIVIVGTIVSSVMLGHFTFFVLCFIISHLGLIEFYRLLGVSKKVLRISGIILSACLLVTFFLVVNYQISWKVILINLPLLSFILTTTLFLKSGNPFPEVAFILLGHIYITLPFILLYWCAFILDGRLFNSDIILGYFFFLWANDTMAYVCGSVLGKNKLAPLISPHKTWEGSAGGALFVIIVAYTNSYFFKELTLINWIVFGIIVIVMGTLGDLVKSVLKRSRNVKDSGNILPGHGGILDRFDSLIGSVPVVYAYLSVLN